MTAVLSRVTRRRLWACALVAAFALPIEAVTLAALRAPGGRDAADAWAASLSNDELQDAADRIESFPYYYRRAVMAMLDPADRAATWRRYLSAYLTAHPSLDPVGRSLIQRGIVALTPDVFDEGPPADRLVELNSIFDAAVTVLGRRTAIDLFMRLGPEDTSFAALPLRARAVETVRSWMAVNAAQNDCDCATSVSMSCDVAQTFGADTCSDAVGCEPDVLWPMCGIVWSVPCNGACAVLAHTASLSR